MKRVLLSAVVLALSTLIGCDSPPGKRDDTTVEVKATVTGSDGQPLSKQYAIVLQPTGDVSGSLLTATTDGTFTGKAVPGKYVYYVKYAKGDATPKNIPATYREPNEKHTVDVSKETPITIKLSE